jgi:hypothetical protein
MRSSSLREDAGEEIVVEFEKSRQTLVSMLIQQADSDSDYYIGASLAGIVVDAHNHASSYHLCFGAGIASGDNLVQALHRLSYLERQGVEVLELG